MMLRVLLTGASGVGKSTVVAALAELGYREVEPLLRAGADFEIDTSVPIEEVVDRLLACTGLR